MKGLSLELESFTSVSRACRILITIFSEETSVYLWGKGGWGHKESKEPFSGFRSLKLKNKGKKGGVIGYGLAV